MTHPFVICLAACLAIGMTTGLKAQNTGTTFKETYEKETLLLDLDRNQYVKNNEKKKIGFFGQKLEGEFERVSPESKEEFKTFSRQTKRGKIMLIGGGALFLTAAVAAPFITLPVFAAGFGAGIGTYYAGVFDVYRSRKHLNKAVWLRNRDVLAKQ